MTPEEINHYNLNQGEIDITEVMNKHLYDKVVSKCNQLEEENKELVTKCNQLEKTLEKTKETLFEEEDRIKSFIENKHELLKKIEQLEKENKKLIGVLNLNREIQEDK